MLTLSTERFEKIQKEAPADYQSYLVQVTKYQAARNCKVIYMYHFATNNCGQVYPTTSLLACLPHQKKKKKRILAWFLSCVWLYAFVIFADCCQKDLHNSLNFLSKKRGRIFSLLIISWFQWQSWIVGKWITPREQRWAPSGTHFHQFVVPPILQFRRDCTYGDLAAMRLPEDVEGLGSCEVIKFNLVFLR